MGDCYHWSKNEDVEPKHLRTSLLIRLVQSQIHWKIPILNGLLSEKRTVTVTVSSPIFLIINDESKRILFSILGVVINSNYTTDGERVTAPSLLT
jgi:hypothetical protein